MSKYTTGEMAKLCGITVRTVQYYDTRGLLVPADLTDGGRRLYSDDDLYKMKVICFLRDIGLSINAISQLLAEEHPENVIDLLLNQQKEILEEEINQKSNQLKKLELLQKELKSTAKVSVESIGDIAYQMENKKKLRKVRLNMIAAAVPLVAIEIAAIIYAVIIHAWWPILVYLAISVAFAIPFSIYYLNNVSYICPECHTVFKPTFKEAFFANHTPTTRKLTCTNCGHHGFCVETYGGK